MSRSIFFLVLLSLSACTTSNINTQKTVPTPQNSPSQQMSSSQPAFTKENVALPTTKQIFYDPKVANYINQNQAAIALRTSAPEFAHKLLAPHCTIEKFVSGLNSTQTEINKTSPSTIEIKTTGTKIGNGNIIIKTQGKNAEISSAVIGKFKRTDSNILKKFAQNICNSIDEKLK